jgi:hypothetical protein
LPLGQIVVLAGYAPAAAEEVFVDEPPAPEPEPTIPRERQPRPEQVAELRRLAERFRELDPGTDWAGRMREIAGVPSTHLTATIAAGLIEQLHAVEQELAA